MPAHGASVSSRRHSLSLVRHRENPSSGGPLARIIFLTAGLVVAGPIIGIRVQTLDLVMAAAAMWVLWSWRRAPWQSAAVLPLIAVVWVNLHAGWVMLFLLGGATP